MNIAQCIHPLSRGRAMECFQVFALMNGAARRTVQDTMCTCAGVLRVTGLVTTQHSRGIVKLGSNNLSVFFVCLFVLIICVSF